MEVLLQPPVSQVKVTVDPLAKGNPPANGEEFIAMFLLMAERLGVAHLLDEAFNRTTPYPPQDDKDPRRVLAQKLADFRKKAGEPVVKIEGAEEVKDEPGLSELGADAIYFVDPIKAVDQKLQSCTESTGNRRKRFELWSIMSKAIQGNHPDCVSMCVRGDIHGLYKQVCRVVRQNYPLHNLDVLSSIHSLRMRPRLGAHQAFVQEMVKLTTAAQRMKDKKEVDVISVIPTAIMCAMRNDGRFTTSVDNLQRMSPPPTYEMVMDAIQINVLNMKEGAGSSRSNPIHALAAGRQKPDWLPADLPYGVCAIWWETGKCKYDQGCRFAHTRQRGETGQTGHGPNPPGGPRRSREKCPVCDSVGHAIDMCSKFREYKRASRENAKLTAQIAEMAGVQAVAIKAMAAQQE